MNTEEIKKYEAMVLEAESHSDAGNHEKAEELLADVFAGSNTNITVSPFTISAHESTNIPLIGLKAMATFFYAILCRRTKRIKQCLHVYEISFNLYKLLLKLEKDEEWCTKYMSQVIQIQFNVASVYDEIGDFANANLYFTLVLGYLAQIRSADQMSGVAIVLNKLYDKYDKPEKKEILARVLISDNDAEIVELLTKLNQ